MKIRALISLLSLTALSSFASEGAAAKPESADKPASGDAKAKSFAYDMEAWEEGVPPQEVFVLDGTIRVAKKDGSKTLMIDFNPIVDAGAMLGESANGSESISAKFFASKKGRAYPRFGLSVHGNSGHRLILNCAKKQIELVKNEEVLKTAPFSWTSDTWTMLKLEARQSAPGKWEISAKAWPADATEPAEALITHTDDKMKGQGKAAIWGTPFSEMPIYIDDVKIEAAAK